MQVCEGVDEWVLNIQRVSHVARESQVHLSGIIEVDGTRSAVNLGTAWRRSVGDPGDAIVLGKRFEVNIVCYVTRDRIVPDVSG